MGLQIDTQPHFFTQGLTATNVILTATNITLSNNSTILGATSATSIGIGTLSAREIDLVHTPANDGIDPILDIGETTTDGFSGIRVRYEENTNRLLVQTVASPLTSNSVIIDRATGQVGISAIPNQALTVTGNISATGDLFSNNSLLSFGAANITTASPGQIFYGTNSDIILDANSRYELIFDLYYSKATATTAIYAISGTATFTNVVANYIQQPATGIATNGAVTGAGVVAQTAAIIALPATATLTTGVNHYAQIKATVETNTAVRVNLTAWNGAAGTITPLRGSYWFKRRIN